MLMLLGYLCLGGNKSSAEYSSRALESLSAGSQALVNSLRESGEDVQVIRNVHTVVDTGELQLMQACCCSAEVQTDFEPMWCLQNTPVSLDSRSEETTVQSAVIPAEGSTMIDLRNCDEFSIVHLEDVCDPSSQFVMLQTGTAIGMGTGSTSAGVANNAICSSPRANLDTAGEAVAQAPVSVEAPVPVEARVPVEIIGAPAMFVGGNGRHWKRELELSTESEGYLLRQPVDVDSGIWDMMQALGNVPDESGRSDVFHTALEREGYQYSEAQVDIPASASVTTDAGTSQIPPSLQGVYKMFQIADGSDQTESGIREEQVVNKSSYSRASSGARQSSVGGLEDALEPLAVVDFIVHRIEAETVCLERIDSSDTTKAQLQQQELKQTTKSHRKIERTSNQNKLHVDSTSTIADQNADSDGSYEDDELTHRSNEVTTVNVRSDRLTVQTYDSATNMPRMKKKNKDVVRVTSARFGRSLRRRGGSRGRGSWKDPNCEARKSVSADVSRSSSLLDMDDGQQEMARSSEVYSDPSPEHAECQSARAARRYVIPSRQPFTSSPYEWRHSIPAGMETHELFTDRSSSTASGPMSSGFGLFAEPDLLNFEKFPDWMRDLPDALLRVPLSDICIPGKVVVCSI